MHRWLFLAFFAVCAFLARGAAAQSADLGVGISNMQPTTVWGTDAETNFCLTVTNAGPGAATNVVVEFDQDVSYGYLHWPSGPVCSIESSWLGTCTSAAGHRTCVIPKLDPGSYVTMQGVRWPNPTAEAAVFVTATIHSDTPDGNPANNSVTVGVIPWWGAYVRTTAWLSALGGPGAAPGGTFTVLGQIENGGPSNARDVSVTVTLPEHTTLAAVDGPAGTACSPPTPPTVSCTIPDIGVPLGHDYPNVSSYLNVTLAVDASAPADAALPVTFFATASDATTTQAERTFTTIGYVFGPADPAITISAPATAYAEMSYPVSMIVTNNGPGNAYNTQVTLTLKTDRGDAIAAKSSTTSTGWWCYTGSTRLTTVCKSSGMTKGATANLKVTYLLSPDLDLQTSSLTAEAVVSDPYDDNAANNTSTATSQVVVPSWPDVIPSIDPSVINAKAGDLVPFTLHIGNSLPVPGENVVATLKLPPELKLVSVDFPCGTATCALGTIPGRTMMTYTMLVQVVSAVADVGPGNRLFSLEVTTANGGPNRYRVAYGGVRILGSTTDLGITINAPAIVHPGPAQWTFNVTNSGPDTGSAFYIRFLTPPGTTLSKFIGAAAGVCSPPWGGGPVGMISCTSYGLFSPNATWSVTVELNVSADAPSPVPMGAEVVVNDGSWDPSKSNNTATASTVLVNAAGLSLAVIASDASETWEYHVTNNGPDLAKGVIFSIKVPADVTITSVRSNTGRCDFSGCVLGDLLCQAMDTVWVTLHPTKTGLFQVFANAEAANAPQVTIARMLRSRSGTEAVDLSLAASMTPQLLYVGDMATFTYYVTNRGNVAADDATIEIQLPQQFSFVSGSPGCDATHCALGTIVSGDTVSATITAVATSAGYTCTDSHTSCAKAEVNEADNAAAQLAVILPAPASRHRAASH